MKILFLTITLSAAAIVFTACQTMTNMNNAVPNANGNMNGMDHNAMPMNGNMMNQNSMTSNQSMMKSDPNAADSPYECQFIDTMTTHHNSAIEMAKMAVEKTQNAELKTFAQKIISDQNKEITQMKDWREKWFAGKPMARNMEMSGMKSSMPNMKTLETATGKEFDFAFIDAMISHHAGAVQMAKDALAKTEKPEIKTLAQNIIKAQEGEIKKMQAWKTAWSK
jgi:uncharacterized protein (DUF305 family)